jgi:hypothetical protein
MLGDVHIAPFRNLRDFLGYHHEGFSVPALGSVGARVKTNLVYFETNYLVLIAAILVLNL